MIMSLWRKIEEYISNHQIKTLEFSVIFQVIGHGSFICPVSGKVSGKQ